MDTMHLSSYVTKLLFYLGFSPRTKGFDYTREMVVTAYLDKRLCLNQIYASISQKADQPIEAIQTAIRTSLKNAQSTKGFKRLEALMMASFIQPHYLVPPREFLGLVVEYLTYFWDGKQEITPISLETKSELAYN